MDKIVGKICPYCKSEIREGEEAVVCSSCEMPHHKDCWIENRGCTTFGCLGTIDSPIQEEFAAFCTRCGMPNPAFDAFCSRCGASLSLTGAAAPQQTYQNPYGAPPQQPYQNPYGAPQQPYQNPYGAPPQTYQNPYYTQPQVPARDPAGFSAASAPASASPVPEEQPIPNAAPGTNGSRES